MFNMLIDIIILEKIILLISIITPTDYFHFFLNLCSIIDQSAGYYSWLAYTLYIDEYHWCWVEIGYEGRMWPTFQTVFSKLYIEGSWYYSSFMKNYFVCKCLRTTFGGGGSNKYIIIIWGHYPKQLTPYNFSHSMLKNYGT